MCSVQSAERQRSTIGADDSSKSSVLLDEDLEKREGAGTPVEEYVAPLDRGFRAWAVVGDTLLLLHDAH